MKKKTQKRPATKKIQLEPIYAVDWDEDVEEEAEDLLITDNHGRFFLAKRSEKVRWSLNGSFNLPKNSCRKITFLEVIEWAIRICKDSDGSQGDFQPVWEEVLRRLKAKKS